MVERERPKAVKHNKKLSLNSMNILIFKTNIEKNRAGDISPVLNASGGIHKWSIDHEDCDKVLRVESEILTEYDVIDIVSTAGFHCEEMTW